MQNFIKIIIFGLFTVNLFSQQITTKGASFIKAPVKNSVMSSSSLNSDFSNEMIAKALKIAAKSANIDKRVLYTIAKIESSFNPLLIAFTSKNADFNYPNLTKSAAKYKNKWLVSFRGDESDLKRALKDLIKRGYKVDAGIMQINSQNFSLNEVDEIFDLEYNMKKSAQILSKCIERKNIIKNAIECYNKGALRAEQSSDYYQKFKKSYLKDFANIKS